MGLTLPPELNGFLGMLGVPWPNIDEDEIKKDAGAWRTVQAGSQPVGEAADASVRRTQQFHRGESAMAAAQHWNRVGGDSGHVSQAAAAARVAPVALDGTAAVVSAVKVAVGMQAAAGLASVVQAVAFGGAVGVTAATARMYLTRQAMAKVMREGAEGTGRVLAPAMARRVTDPMRRILDNLRRPGGPGGTPALAGAGGRVPVRPSGLRNPNGPRSVRDGMAQMGRRNNRDNSGGRGRGRGRGGGSSGGSSGGGGGWFRRDSTGKVHGELPNGTRGMSEEQGKAARDALRGSIRKRRQEQDRLGQEVGHEERIRREQEALRKIEEEGKRKRWW
ncbi:hypothetical protein [Nonomuraea rubra]|uniref:Putative membrane protein YgcG n=1 Tax=Nonomuraea rubra TaxID=46180 RepID=A0A7X0TVP9_9ACTN|nr:hypothetical protein [Nonomuraea rubra]MBB6545310.1 putative membrane protein YgcG [Nonomuraea rubra]